MPPQLIPCPFCDRLYTHFSIDLHTPQCLSNPSRRVKLPQLKRGAHSSIGPTNNPTKHLPALAERRSRSVGSNSMSGSNSSTNSSHNDENRPATRSLNQNRPPKSRSKNRLNTPKRQKTPKKQEDFQIIDMSKRICFVCGEKVDPRDLMDHEIECEAEWRTMRRGFPNTIRSRSPRAMRIPSIDGTVDNCRIDMYAAESADRAQKTRCLRCCRHVPFAHVLQHQCTRFEPTVQFYF